MCTIYILISMFAYFLIIILVVPSFQWMWSTSRLRQLPLP